MQLYRFSYQMEILPDALLYETAGEQDPLAFRAAKEIGYGSVCPYFILYFRWSYCL